MDLARKEKETLEGREVIAGVTGSIAAYKAAEIVSRLVQRGAAVTVVMTSAATRFVTPLTFQALTRRRVLTDPFDLEFVLDPTHIRLTDKADLVLVAPATANFLAKAAHGIADDMLTSLLLAVDGPVLVAPAMNDRMWRNAAVRENVAALRKRGFRILRPDKGFLACGSYAEGRLADPARIVSEVEKRLRR